MSLRETGFDTPPGRITALRSGDPQGPRVLALHGWLDNAASFVPLAAHFPHISGIARIAPDWMRLGAQRYLFISRLACRR